MTSKEALNSIADKYAIKEYDKDGNLIKWAGTIDKEYLTIMKEIEILEILKEVIKNNVFDVAMLDDRPNGETLLSCEDFGITLKTEDYYKILRGLNNDK